MEKGLIKKQFLTIANREYCKGEESNESQTDFINRCLHECELPIGPYSPIKDWIGYGNEGKGEIGDLFIAGYCIGIISKEIEPEYIDTDTLTKEGQEAYQEMLNKYPPGVERNRKVFGEWCDKNKYGQYILFRDDGNIVELKASIINHFLAFRSIV